jgi:hypothetical protein
MLCRAAVVFCLLVTLGAAAHAQSAPQDNTASGTPTTATELSHSMDPPLVGDYWSYELRDEITGTLKYTIMTVITDVTPGEIAIRAENLGYPGNGFYIYDHTWNLKNDPTWKFSPNDGTGIKPPLAAGSTWKFQGDQIYSGRGASFRRSGSSKVVAQESVTTSAGTFDTFKIETSINTRNVNDPSKKSDVVLTTWYAPAIDHWVKRTSKVSSNGHVDANISLELVDYGRR